MKRDGVWKGGEYLRPLAPGHYIFIESSDNGLFTIRIRLLDGRQWKFPGSMSLREAYDNSFVAQKLLATEGVVIPDNHILIGGNDIAKNAKHDVDSRKLYKILKRQGALK